MLTRRQKQYFEAIRVLLERKGYPPNVREIGEEIGVRSSVTVHNMLDRLEETGIIERATGPRTLRIIKSHFSLK